MQFAHPDLLPDGELAPPLPEQQCLVQHQQHHVQRHQHGARGHGHAVQQLKDQGKGHIFHPSFVFLQRCWQQVHKDPSQCIQYGGEQVVQCKPIFEYKLQIINRKPIFQLE